MPTQPTRQPRPGSRQKPRKRVVSPQRRAMYRRRRAVALVIVLAAVSLVVFCVYSLGRGVVDGMSLLRPTPIARESVPAPKKTSGVNDCGASDVKLSLTAASQGVPVGGSLDFTASISYEGTSSCLLDLSQKRRSTAMCISITVGQRTRNAGRSIFLQKRWILFGSRLSAERDWKKN